MSKKLYLMIEVDKIPGTPADQRAKAADLLRRTADYVEKDGHDFGGFHYSKEDSTPGGWVISHTNTLWETKLRLQSLEGESVKMDAAAARELIFEALDNGAENGAGDEDEDPEAVAEDLWMKSSLAHETGLTEQEMVPLVAEWQSKRRKS